MVALIWRHLATRPGVLDAMWKSLALLMATGAVQETAWHGAQVAVRGMADGFNDERLRAAGVDAGGQAALANVLDAYNRANPVNFVMVAILRELVRDPETRGSAALRPGHMATTPATPGSPATLWRPPTPLPQLPPMCPIAALDGPVRRCIDDLSSDPSVDRSRVVPTLYRHLDGWPLLIPLIHDVLIQRFRSGEIGQQVRRVSDALAEAGRQLVPRAGTLGLIDNSTEVSDTLDRFAKLIPEMVVVGLLLRRALP